MWKFHRAKLRPTFIVLALFGGVWGYVLPADAQEDFQRENSAAEQRAQAEPPAQDEPVFLRVRRDENNQPVAMETSIVTYMPDDGESEGLIIDLIGAVHIGDDEYYDELNEQFPAYESLLYELVIPADAEDAVPRGERDSDHPVASIQNVIQEMLELSHQLDGVDYEAENFVHADMSIEEFNQTMRERGESWLQMYFQAMGQSIAAQSQQGGGPSDLQLLMALFSPERPLLLKRIMADQFENMGGTMDIFSGEDGSTIITERNRKALEVLDEQIDAGQRRVGIFYGAGHMADFEERLIEDYGLVRGEVRWLVAWDLTRDQSARDDVAPPEEEQADEAAVDELNRNEVEQAPGESRGGPRKSDPRKPDEHHALHKESRSPAIGPSERQYVLAG